VAVPSGFSVPPQRRGRCDAKVKRLEQGRFHVPAADTAALELSPAQLHMPLGGIDLSRVRQFKRYQRPAGG
jgi:IS66 Orf2 like protein